jgi:hypothetical protein
MREVLELARKIESDTGKGHRDEEEVMKGRKLDRRLLFR